MEAERPRLQARFTTARAPKGIRPEFFRPMARLIAYHVRQCHLSSISESRRPTIFQLLVFVLIFIGIFGDFLAGQHSQRETIAAKTDDFFIKGDVIWAFKPRRKFAFNAHGITSQNSVRITIEIGCPRSWQQVAFPKKSELPEIRECI